MYSEVCMKRFVRFTNATPQSTDLTRNAYYSTSNLSSGVLQFKSEV